MNTEVALFQGVEVRKVEHNNEWWFVIEDVVKVLVDSKDAKQYVQKIRKRDPELEKGWVQIVLTLDVETDGGMQKMNCSNTKGILRIIQAIPSPKAEPFKQWLAQVGHERLQEIADPSIAAERSRQIYRTKGYSDKWINRRMRGIDARETLTHEWDERGIEGKEYGILTAEISRSTFGMTPGQYREYKGLKKKENLRDNMTDLELIFTMLGEVATTEITRSTDAHGFYENKNAAQEGGKIAREAREKLEEKTKKKVISKDKMTDMLNSGNELIQ